MFKQIKYKHKQMLKMVSIALTIFTLECVLFVFIVYMMARLGIIQLICS